MTFFDRDVLVKLANGVGVWLVCLAAVPLQGRAGTVSMVGGGQLTGEVKQVKQPDGRSAHVIVRVDGDLSVAVAGVYARGAVESAELSKYREYARAAENDAEKNYELARWCKQNTLLHQYKFHLQRAIAINPEHSKARAALRFVKHRGEWISYERLQRSQGLVLDGKGRWVLPAVLVDREQREANDKAAKLWIRDLKRMQSRAMRGDAEALAEIQAINDPLALTALSGEFLKLRKNKANLRTLRITYLRKMVELSPTGAVATLVEAGLNEIDDVIREEALRHLQELPYGRSSAIASYLPLLRSGSPATVRAAARALAFFPDPELAMQYVDALVTQQKVRVKIGSDGTQGSFSPSGPSGLSSGSKIVESTKNIQHPQVLQLVKTIAPEVDYGYDESTWRRYFAKRRSPPRDDLRRDLSAQ